MNGQIYFTRDQGPLIKQMLGFQPRPDGSTGLKHDDLIDSASMHVPFWQGKHGQAKPEYADDDDIEDWTDRGGGQRVASYGLQGET